eukprot:CAMPEP_0172763444 /NCGR_PEP_ID=MMETSP1074-20121228/175327_1 /TAXON_ID=2916 /ORGANISM="Ceratium fusus, Strain PA161109" /LENGTH=31 /DNA_ID= /DNA_START= /DNA_END= /DNA_ORIENTATION=
MCLSQLDAAWSQTQVLVLAPQVNRTVAAALM